jgi:hypothetical protein
MRVCGRRHIGPAAESRRLLQEGNELIAIVSAIIRNKKRNVAEKTRRTREEKERAKAARPQRDATNSEFRLPNSEF